MANQLETIQNESKELSTSKSDTESAKKAADINYETSRLIKVWKEQETPQDLAEQASKSTRKYISGKDSGPSKWLLEYKREEEDLALWEEIHQKNAGSLCDQLTNLMEAAGKSTENICDTYEGEVHPSRSGKS